MKVASKFNENSIVPCLLLWIFIDCGLRRLSLDFVLVIFSHNK